MSRVALRYRLDDGRQMTVGDMLRHESNTWPVTYQCVYERLKAGDRTLERLLRPTRARPALAKLPARKVTPWRLGPTVSTPRARELQAQRQTEPTGESLEGEVFGSLEVLRHGPLVGGDRTWTCRCDCGNRVTYWSDSLRDGIALDCGCGVARRGEKA